MPWQAEIGANGQVSQFVNANTGESISLAQYQKCMQIYQSLPKHDLQAAPLHSHAFLSATEVAILLPTMVLLVLVILAARARVPFGRKKNSTQYDNF